MTEDYSAYVGRGHNRPEDVLEITRLAEAQFAAEQKVAKLEEELKLAQQQLKEIAENLLPEKMDALGLETFKTKTGISIKVKEKIRASLSVENKPKAYSWLEENGYSGLIKSQVIVPFSKNEIEQARQLVKELKDKDRLSELERDVHHATLSAFVREHLTQGKDIPLDVFGVYRQRIAEVEI